MVEHHFPQALADAKPASAVVGGYLRKSWAGGLPAATGVPKRAQTGVLNSAYSLPKPVAFPAERVGKADKNGDPPAVGQTEPTIKA
jgi:hypothetical protein